MGKDPSDNSSKDAFKLPLNAGGKSIVKSAAATPPSKDSTFKSTSKDGKDLVDDTGSPPLDVNMLVKRKQEEEVSANAEERKADKEVKESQKWRDKYNEANARLLEVQAARTMLNAEISKLQHALQKEVGDHIPISKVLEEGGDWKGRSQQICILKDKVTELKSRLKKQSVDGSEQGQSESFENAQRREYEQLGAKLLACREELRNTKQKLNGVLARRNVLENELKVAKEKMSLLMGKSDNDDRLITALRLEIEAQRQLYREEKDCSAGEVIVEAQ